MFGGGQTKWCRLRMLKIHSEARRYPLTKHSFGMVAGKKNGVGSSDKVAL
jgi:hypothetical protein